LTVALKPLHTLDPELLEQLKTEVREPLLERVAEAISKLEIENRCLREIIRLARIAKYGAGAEKLSDAQLELLELEPGVSQAEVQAETVREPLPVAPKQPRQHPGRQELPVSLPRVDRLIACTPEQCICAQCAKETTVIGYESAERLDYEPIKFFVEVTKREKRACKNCEEEGVKCAPLPARIIDKSLVSDRIIIDTVVSKFADHLPLYRQSVILEREAGIELSRATLNGWVMRVGELSRLIVSAMRQELLKGSYIQADETTVGVQMHDGRGKNHQGYLWQFSAPNGPAIFEFRLGRDREGARQFLGVYEGILQSDGYGAYDQIGGPRIVYAGCWAHARRKFFDAVKLSPTDTTSIHIVALMDELFKIDRQAREQDFDLDKRHALRLEKSKALIEQIKKRIDAARGAALPKSALAKACTYTLMQWSRLTRFLEYPELELSNNLAENSMRPVALGRKNWIHIGSKEAGPRIAAILSLVETCRRLKIPVRAYLAGVLPGLADFPANRVAELTPSAWLAHKN
jgi:transposase